MTSTGFPLPEMRTSENAPEVGEQFSMVRETTPDQAIRYANASGDHNPIHEDDDFAKSVGLKGSILHGLCTMAFLSQGVCEFMGDPAGVRKLKARFSNPVYPGDVLTVAGKVISRQANQIRFKMDCHNQEKDLTVSGSIDYVLNPNDPPEKLPVFNPIEPSVPNQFRVTEESIIEYAKATNDPNPIYWDREFAVKSHYGQIVGPPLYCVVFAMIPFKRTYLETAKDQSILSKILHGGQEFEIFRVLRPGDPITTRGGVERKSQRKGQEFIYYSTESIDPEGQMIGFGRTLAIMQA